MSKLGVRLVAILCIVPSTGLVAAKPRSFDIKAGGRFEIDVPEGWTVAIGGADEEVVPWLTVRAPAGKETALELTLARITNKSHGPMETVRRGTEAMAADLKKISVENELPMQEIKGANCTGLYVTATDRTVDKPTPDNFKYITQGGLVAGREFVMFNLLTNFPDGPERKKAFDIVRSARHVPAASPEK